MEEKDIALEAIRKKLVGKTLVYDELYAIMDEIANDKLGDVLTTYFVASGYSKGFTDKEVYYFTRAMVETGQKLHFKGIVADKHSIGGIPGTRATMVIVPIIAASGFTIPKSSSRAITTPAGTADAMEVLAKVTFDEQEIYRIVEKTKACIVWGGSFKIAPADDKIIHIEEPLLFESYDKILVSVMAKKVAFGSNHVVIDLPYGKTVKLHRLSDAELLAEKFIQLAKHFDIKLRPIISRAEEPAGPGIGPLLEAREALKVLEQTEDRALALEHKSLDLAGELLEICLSDSSEQLKTEIKNKYGNARGWAKNILESGKALLKMKEIIECQKGNPKITSSHLTPGHFSFDVHADKKGTVALVNNKDITVIAKILGAPKDKKAGIFLRKRLHDKVEKGEIIYNLYAENMYNLKEAMDSLNMFPIFIMN